MIFASLSKQPLFFEKNSKNMTNRMDNGKKINQHNWLFSLLEITKIKTEKIKDIIHQINEIQFTQ